MNADQIHDVALFVKYVCSLNHEISVMLFFVKHIYRLKCFLVIFLFNAKCNETECKRKFGKKGGDY